MKKKLRHMSNEEIVRAYHEGICTKTTIVKVREKATEEHDENTLFVILLMDILVDDQLSDMEKEIDKRLNHSKRGRKPKNWKPIDVKKWLKEQIEKLQEVKKSTTETSE